MHRASSHLHRMVPLLTLLLVAPGACSRPAGPAPAGPTPGTEADRRAVAEALEASAAGWNAGSLDRFLTIYADDPTTTFVSGNSVRRGRTEVREAYQRNYFARGAPSQTLRFDELEVRAVGPETLLSIGRYTLSDRVTGERGAQGRFSLVWVRTPQGWRVVHDHSS